MSFTAGWVLTPLRVEMATILSMVSKIMTHSMVAMAMIFSMAKVTAHLLVSLVMTHLWGAVEMILSMVGLVQIISTVNLGMIGFLVNSAMIV